MRFFNTAGPADCADHYCLPGRLSDEGAYRCLSITKETDQSVNGCRVPVLSITKYTALSWGITAAHISSPSGTRLVNYDL